MIVTYLARLMLLLPELTPSDANHLEQVVHSQQNHRHRVSASESTEPIDVISHRDATPVQPFGDPLAEALSYDPITSRWPTERRLAPPTASARLPPPRAPDEPSGGCVPINETLRKYLIQVRHFEFVND